MIRRSVILLCSLMAVAFSVLWILDSARVAWLKRQGSPYRPIGCGSRWVGGVVAHHQLLLAAVFDLNNPIPPPPLHAEWAGFQLSLANNRSPGGGYRHLFIKMPLWFPIIVFSIYPAIAFIRGPYRRYRRRKKGLCLTCGYNLTGNVSGICPECGVRI